MVELNEANNAVDAISQAPLRLARELLAQKDFALDNPINDEQLAVLKSRQGEHIGECHFKGTLHNLVFLGGAMFKLVNVQLLVSEKSHLTDLLIEQKIDAREYAQSLLYPQAHKLLITTHRPANPRKFNTFTIFATPDSDLVAVNGLHLAHSIKQGTQANPLQYELDIIRQKHGEEALITLRNDTVRYWQMPLITLMYTCKLQG